MITDRIDAITLIPDAWRRPDPPSPKSIKIEISPRCNYRCGFCALRTREKQPRKDMEFELFRRITGEMREAGVEEIGLFYLGESFMNPGLLLQSIRHLKEDIGMPYVFLTSNASLATPKAVDACMAAGLDSLKWSINASDESQFSQVMGVSDRMFGKALQNVKAAWEVREWGGYPTSLSASSIRYDDAQAARMQSMLDEHVLPYVDTHYWLPLYSMGSFATQREGELEYRPTAGNQGRIGALREPLPCWAVFTEGHVTAEGKLSACCFDAGGHWTMGDLTTHSFSDCWNSSAFRQLREAHLKKDVTGTPCEKCVAYN